MSNETDYKKAYEEQRRARERAEALLEVHSRDLFDTAGELGTISESLDARQAKLVQQEKLASIGLLAAGIAHEINNPIGYIKSNLQTLVDYLSLINRLFDSFLDVSKAADSQSESMDYRASLEQLIKLARENDLTYVIRDSLECIEECLSGAERVQNIINNLKDFARSDPDRRTLCDINNVLSSTLILLANEVKYSCEIEKHFGELPQIYACEGQLSQVFMNIMINAIQAMGDDGRLEVTSEAVGDDVRIHFVDNGPGVNEEDMARLFDPFFTTKEVGAGTGLGLYVSHGLVEKHRGSIEVSNEPHGGARFTVVLPVDMRASVGRD